MLRWLVPTILFSAAPSLAATLTCTADGGRIEGTKAAQVDVAVDGRLYRLANPNAAKPLPGAHTDAAARLGMVAIVLPAPKPGPDDANRAAGALVLRMRSASLAVSDPYAHDLSGFENDDLSDLEVVDETEPAASSAEVPDGAAHSADLASGADANANADLSAAAADGCSVSGAPAPMGLGGLLMLLALGLRRRLNGGAR
jgi:MYXO-CTERM domain-containing protein